MEELEVSPKRPKIKEREEYGIYKTQKATPADLISDQTSFQAKIVCDSLIHIN